MPLAEDAVVPYLHTALPSMTSKGMGLRYATALGAQIREQTGHDNSVLCMESQNQIKHYL